MGIELADVDSLISNDQYLLPQAEKETKLLAIFREQIRHTIEVNEHMERFYHSFGVDPEQIHHIADISPLPVTMFKNFNLQTCKDEDIVRILNSSATTSGVPSRIPIDKTTSLRQTKALVSTLKNYLGTARRPFLVIDTSEVNDPGAGTISARGAAIRGISNFARGTTYVLDNVDGELLLNQDVLNEFIEKNKGKEILAFGFTYIIWTRFLDTLEEAGVTLDMPDIKILHGGGWKKLTSQAVTKDIFNTRVGALFNTDPSNVIDYYGMVEQLGVLFLDCPYGYKHVPDFAEVIMRDIYTMEEVPIGTPGLIEVMSTLGTSYPSQAVLTEDIGEVVGIDDCPCGRKGKYFMFRSRVEKAEIRGCGDTFAERQGD